MLLERLEDITKAIQSKTFSKLIPQTSPRCLEAFERTLPGLNNRQLSELAVCSDDVFISYFVDHKMDPTRSKLLEVTLAIFEITHFGKIRRYHDQRGQIDEELDVALQQGAQLEQTRNKYLRGLDRLREKTNRISDWESDGVFRARNVKFKFSKDLQDWVLTDFVFIPFSKMSALDKIKWKSIVSKYSFMHGIVHFLNILLYFRQERVQHYQRLESWSYRKPIPSKDRPRESASISLWIFFVFFRYVLRFSHSRESIDNHLYLWDRGLQVKKTAISRNQIENTYRKHNHLAFFPYGAPLSSLTNIQPTFHWFE